MTEKRGQLAIVDLQFAGLDVMASETHSVEAIAERRGVTLFLQRIMGYRFDEDELVSVRRSLLFAGSWFHEDGVVFNIEKLSEVSRWPSGTPRGRQESPRTHKWDFGARLISSICNIV